MTMRISAHRSPMTAAGLPAVTPLISVDGARSRWHLLALRGGLMSTGALVFNIALQCWQLGDLGSHRGVVGIVFSEYALALLLVMAAVLPAATARRAAPLIIVAVLYSLIAWSYVKIDINLRVYGTDNAAFSHVAAEKLLGGVNPYTLHDGQLIQDTAHRFGVPTTFVTSTTDGRPLENLMSWPAGSVIALLPARALGLADMRWVVVAFEACVIALVWLRAPSALRPVVLLPIIIDPDLFLQFTGGGVMDFIWVLPIVAAAIALYAGRLRWSAICYGLASGTKQQPWLLMPFLLIYVWHLRHERPAGERAMHVASYAGASGVGFLVLNAPFMLWGFQDWLRGVLLPFREQLVPFGSGISLLTQTGAMTLPKDFYSAATFMIWGALALIYAMYFRSLRHALWVAPAIIMWFGYRSLQNYFVYWTPPMLVALAAWWEDDERIGAADLVAQDAFPARRPVLVSVASPEVAHAA